MTCARAVAGLLLGLFTSCTLTSATIGAPDRLRAGIWGADMSGAIVTDSSIHVHVNCTLGDFPLPAVINADGSFRVNGSYTLRAYPIARESLPAQLSGVVRGNVLTLSVAVNDTVNKQPVAVGPVTLTFGRQPSIPPCPICRTPGDSASLSAMIARWLSPD